MINRRVTLQRRDSTLFLIPWYPSSKLGFYVRNELRLNEKCQDVTSSDDLWGQWLHKLVKQGHIMQVADGEYARPRNRADLRNQYKRKRKYHPPAHPQFHGKRAAQRDTSKAQSPQ